MRNSSYYPLKCTSSSLKDLYEIVWFLLNGKKAMVCI